MADLLALAVVFILPLLAAIDMGRASGAPPVFIPVKVRRQRRD